MKVKLNVPERITLMGLMPARGNLFDKLVARDLIDKVQFSKQEVKHHGLEMNQGNWSWKKGGEKKKEIELDMDEVDLVSRRVQAFHETENVDDFVIAITLKLGILESLKEALKGTKNVN